MNFDWLDPSHWSRPVVMGVRIAIILVVALGVNHALQRLTRLLRERLTRDVGDTEQLKRAQTLGRAFRYVISVVMWVLAGTLVLGTLNIPIAPILGAAGVAGVAVGFGAQSLIKDYFTGFFLLLENQLRQGDAVELGGKTGVVEEITLRYIRLRDYGGNVHYIPNSLVTTVTNMSRGHSYALIDINIAPRGSVDAVIAIMRDVGEDLGCDATFGPKVLEAIEVAGIERWDAASLTMRARIKTQPLEQWNVRREYFRRLKNAFDTQHIEMAAPPAAPVSSSKT